MKTILEYKFYNNKTTAKRMIKREVTRQNRESKIKREIEYQEYLDMELERMNAETDTFFEENSEALAEFERRERWLNSL